MEFVQLDDVTTLYAIWTPNEYIITYNANGSISSIRGADPVKYNAALKDTIENGELPIPEKEHYLFIGWTDGNIYYTKESIYLVTIDLILYAVWEKIEYEITYHLLNNQTVKTFYNITENDYENTALMNLNNTLLQVDGYKLTGFYLTSTYTGDSINILPHGTIGDISIYCKFEKIYVLKFYRTQSDELVGLEIVGTLVEIAQIALPSVDVPKGYIAFWASRSNLNGSNVAFKSTGYTGQLGWELIVYQRERTFAECLNTSTNQFEIYLLSQFVSISNGISGNRQINLKSDISLAGYSNWTPLNLGSGATFDGEGHTISNLTISKYVSGSVNSDEYYGLFGRVTGTIKNFSLTNVNIYYQSPDHAGSGWIYIGGAVGYHEYGFIQGITITGSIAGHREKSSIGGVAGYTSNKINGCKVNATLGGNGDIGGIVGTGTMAFITGCIVENTVINLYIAYCNRSVGGIIGAARNTTIATSKVNNTAMKFIGYGGLSGQDLLPTIGLLVGYFSNSFLISNTVSGSYIDTGSLTSNYKYGFLNLGSHNQKARIGNGPGGVYGYSTNGSAIL